MAQIIDTKLANEFGKDYVKVLVSLLKNNRPYAKVASGSLVNSVNYRFTPTVAGKYFFFTGLYIDGTTTSSPTGSYFYKNGTKWSVGLLYSGGLAGQQTSNIILDMNGSSDYVEVYVKSGNPSPFLGATAGGQMSSYFGGYKIMGA